MRNIPSRALLLAGLSPLAFASPVSAQPNQEAAQTPQAQAQAQAEVVPDDQIIVTGTRASNRTVADSPVPVDVIGADAIANSGQTETNRILNQLVPAFNFPTPAIADGSDALRPATLRGLSPDQTLVLVNGKRRHVSALLNINGTVGRGSAAVDLNLIPGLAISRVEVLRDGAAAQYGSDAIAGVINIQLKKGNQGGRASITYGKYITTIDDVANVTGLQTNGAGQPFVDPTDTRYLAAITDGDRKARDGDQVTAAVNLGFGLGSGGFVNLTGEYHYRERTNRQGFDLRPNFLKPTATTGDLRELTFDRLQFRFGDPELRDYNLFLNSGLEVGGGWEAYAFGSYGKRNSVSGANWRQGFSAQNRDWSVLAPNQAPNDANFVPLTAIGFLPLIETDLKDYAGTIGVRGEVAAWNVDLSAGRGHNRFDYEVHDTLNTSFGPASPSDFDAGGLRYGQTIFNLDVSREFPVGFAKPLTVAAGAEHRREQFKIRPGDFPSWGIGPFFRASFATTAENCATSRACSMRRPASAASPAARHWWAPRASPASPTAPAPVRTATAGPLTPSSTPTRSKA